MELTNSVTDQQIRVIPEVQAELHSRISSVRFMHFAWPDDTEIDLHMRPLDRYWLDLSLTSRPHQLEGRFSHRPDSRSFSAIGNLFIVPPGETLQVRTSEQKPGQARRQTSIICLLDPVEVERWFKGELDCARFSNEMLDVRDQNIRGLLLRLIREVTAPGISSETAVELVSSLLAIEIARYCEKIDHALPKGGLSAWRLRLIDERLQELGGPPSIGELADLCPLSPRQLMRCFSVSRGCTIGTYIASSRLGAAQRMLAQGGKVKIVAHSLGYASVASFCGAFKRQTGVSPKEYSQRS